MRIIVIASALAVFLATPSSAQQASEQEAQKAGESVLDAWNNATLKKDAAGKAGLYTEDAIQITPQGLISGRAAIEKSETEMSKALTFQPSKLENVVMIGGDILLRVGSWSATFNSPNGPVPLKGYWSDVDVRDGNGWKIRRETYNVTPPPQ
jgi:ketosteroid isomerase-like protein